MWYVCTHVCVYLYALHSMKECWRMGEDGGFIYVYVYVNLYMHYICVFEYIYAYGGRFVVGKERVYVNISDMGTICCTVLRRRHQRGKDRIFLLYIYILEEGGGGKE